MTNATVRWLLAYAFVLGTGFGGALFELVVIVPEWSRSPDAARAWTTEAAPFFIVVSPLIALLAIAVLVVTRRAPAAVRTWARLGAVAYLMIFITTLGFYAPEQTAIKGEPSVGLTDAELISRIDRWVTLNNVRQAVGVVAWGATLYALAIASRALGRSEGASAGSLPVSGPPPSPSRRRALDR